jgi:uncharacterized C2H2 Zn-finger protein
MRQGEAFIRKPCLDPVFQKLQAFHHHALIA